MPGASILLSVPRNSSVNNSSHEPVSFSAEIMSFAKIMTLVGASNAANARAERAMKKELRAAEETRDGMQVRLSNFLA